MAYVDISIGSISENKNMLIAILGLWPLAFSKHPMSSRFRRRSIQLELELILDVTVSGTAWQGFDLGVTVVTLTVEMVSISKLAVAVSMAAGRQTAVVVGRAAAGPLASAVDVGPILVPCLHPVL
jgi:hypothetical protein